MRHFDLQEYLRNHKRKVVTRDGRKVRILCWDAENSKPIVALVSTRSISRRQFDELIIDYFDDGTYYGGGVNEDSLDLFFADDECEQSEFENTMVDFAHKMFDHLLDSSKEVNIEEWKRKLLDLARQELQSEIDKELDDAYKSRDEVVYNEGVDKGREETIRQYPRWRLAESEQQFDKHILLFEGDRVCFTDYVDEGELYLELNDLLNLPKEEE